MSLLRTMFQSDAADIICDLLDKHKIVFRKTVFNSFKDRTISLFFILSKERLEEICVLEQIVFQNNKKSVYIFFGGRKKRWNKQIVKRILDAVIEKAEPAPEFLNIKPQNFIG